jgi:hypothetical protein
MQLCDGPAVHKVYACGIVLHCSSQDLKCLEHSDTQLFNRLVYFVIENALCFNVMNANSFLNRVSEIFIPSHYKKLHL